MIETIDIIARNLTLIGLIALWLLFMIIWFEGTKP